MNEARDRVSDLRTTGLYSDVGQSLSTAAQEIFRDTRVRFSLAAAGSPRRLNPEIADDIYRVGRETLIDVGRHSKATDVNVTPVLTIENREGEGALHRTPSIRAKGL